MTLVENTLFGIEDKVAQSIKILKHFQPKEGYYLAFSGGKDSVALKHVADLAGVKYDAHYSVTTIDPPELVRFIKEFHKDVIWEFPDKPMLVKMITRGFWLRQHRWCCSEYKERGGSGRSVLVGVRAAESNKRALMPFTSIRQERGVTKTIIRPILKWTDKDVWEFIRRERLPYCKLYDEGFKRLGCLFCPMAGAKMRKRELSRYPRFAQTFKLHFQKLYEAKKHLESYKRWRSGEELWEWWIKEHDRSKSKEVCDGRDLFAYGD